MKKVAYLVSRFPNLPETFILREMNALQARGFQVELFPLIVQDQAIVHPEARAWLEKLHHSKPFSGRCLAANLRMLLRRPGSFLYTFFQLVWLNLPSPGFLARAIYIFPRAVEMAQEMRELGIEHVHAHYATHPATAAWIIHKFSDIPYSVTVHAHDIYVDRTMLKPKLRQAAFVRSISAFNKKFLVEHCGAGIGEKTFVVHCGIQPDCYQAKKEKRTSVFNIISVGSLQEYKGHEYLINACGILKKQDLPFKCTIAGGGELFGSLTDQIEKKGLDDCIYLAGPQTQETIADLLSHSDCFVLPSIITRTRKMEGIPVVLMEALASRLPVIASDISGISELIEHQKCGLLTPPEDAQAIARSIRWIYEHPKQSAEMAEAGYRKVMDEFNLDKNIKELISLFQKFNSNKMTAGEK